LENVTASGEICLQRLSALLVLHLPVEQLITTIGTIVEAHTSRVLEELLLMSEVSHTRTGSILLEEARDKLDATWESRADTLKNHFDVEYKGTGPYQDLLIVVNARNAVVHGDGHLTRRQLRNVNQLQKLRSDFRKKLTASIRGRIHFTATSGRQAMVIARAFVFEFDSLLLQKHPNYLTHESKSA
jgi:hypothetical protein